MVGAASGAEQIIIEKVLDITGVRRQKLWKAEKKGKKHTIINIS